MTSDPAVDEVERERLVQAVQTNCHIADARHATELGLCNYLLQMRELFRWEQRRPWAAPLPRGDVGGWIAERESLWAQLEERDLLPLPCGRGAEVVDPFDVATVNRRLSGTGLLYGAGLVGAGRPVFFLADQHGHSVRQGLPVWVAGREHARGLLAPTAMLAGGGEEQGDGAAIVLRRESLARGCWEKFEAFTLRPQADSAFDAVVRDYGFAADFDAALPRWLDEQGEVATLHELGEHRVGCRLGPGWAAMRLALPTRRGDLYARAVRDHLADLDTTLPTLLERAAAPSIHAWFAHFDGVRRLLMPSLEGAYGAWRLGDGGQALRRALAMGAAHFMQLAQQALALHAGGGADAGAAIEALLTDEAARCTG